MQKANTQRRKVNKHGLKKVTTTQDLYFTSQPSHCSTSSPKAGLIRLYLHTELYSHSPCAIKYLQLQSPGGAQTLLNTNSSSCCCRVLLAGKINRGREETCVSPCCNIISAFTLAHGRGMQGSSTGAAPQPCSGYRGCTTGHLKS